MTQFLVQYFLLLITGTMFIVGWYAITRGRVELTPDGTPFKTGKIFKGWHFFWTRGSDYEMQISGKPLIDIFLKIREADYLFIKINELNSHLTYSAQDTEIQLHKMTAIANDIYNPENKGNPIKQQRVKAKLDQGRIFFYLTRRNFEFPEWVRDPISECPTCMASVYGSLFYFVITSFNKGMFAWSVMPIVAYIFFWVVFCISCAFINTVLAKKI